MKRLLLFLLTPRRCVSLIAATLCTLTAAATSHSLNGDWIFRLAESESEGDSLVAAGFGSTDFDTAGFVPTIVPSCWAVMGFEEPVYRVNFEKDDHPHREGFYVRRFSVPNDMHGKRLLLCFGGVWASAEVWVNGKRMGRHDSGFTSFSYDITDAVTTAGSNTLAVRVRQVYPGYQCDTYDDWSLGGIYRDVTLKATPAKRYIERVTARTAFEPGYEDATLSVDVMVADRHKTTLPGNYPSPAKGYTVKVTLLDERGSVAYEGAAKVRGHCGTGKQTTVRLPLKSPKKWTAETPYLYDMRVELAEDGKTTCQYREKTGIRQVEIRNKTLLLNGQPVTLRGVNRHDEHPDVGRATDRRHWLEDLTLMKRNNVNFVRACHYQHAKGFIEMCDSLGMYVGAEVSLGGAGEMMYGTDFLPQVMLRVGETVLRDLNNPSIIYWSIGNEDPFTDMHLLAAKAAKAFDPTRPTLLPWNADNDLPTDIDMLSVHYWTAAEYDSLAATASRPIITTEYAHAYGTQRFGGMEECWKALTRHSAGAGGAVWMWADQGIRTPIRKTPSRKDLAKDDDYLRLEGEGWDGVTDAYRQPTRDLLELRAVYLPIQPVTDTVAVTDGKAEIPMRNGYDFTDMSTTTLRWTAFIDGRATNSGEARLSATPHTAATLHINTKEKTIKEGETAYAVIDVIDADGNLLGRKAVTLDYGEKRTKAKVKDIAVEYSRQTGLPSRIGSAIVSLRPTVWHKLSDGDCTVKNARYAKGATPEDFTAKVLRVSETQEGMTSSVEYAIVEANSILAEYASRRNTDGSVTVEYAITPRLQTTLVPMVGLAVELANGISPSRWLGKGPDEAYPNKQAAPVMGVWDAKGFTSCRRADWIEMGDVRVTTHGGYIQHDSATDGSIRILSRVLGRPEKGRLNAEGHKIRNGVTYRGMVTFSRAKQ